ncbi:MAG: peptide chain release factor N(5)-glutamine methyltransferase [Gammaproteobacteria bacterium]|jgi:release factor glutamine methyltransferase|nr:peptide chain release factor N(5)-glutamine methyltransferase [Gammaproteobacteria bacterium]
MIRNNLDQAPRAGLAEPGDRCRDTLGDLLREASRILEQCSGSARLDAELLLSEAAGGDRTLLYAHSDRIPTAAQRERFEQLILRRRRGEPIAYLLGRREFWSLTLAVGPGVLIPRPETELLVERTLAREPGGRARVLDLGTGSGAIALALAIERPDWKITATDVDAETLRTANDNMKRLGAINVNLKQGDWFGAVAGERFDLVVGNPPYVEAGDPHLESLKYEPRQALVSGGDGLRDIRRIVSQAPDYLAGGWLLLEHGATQGDAVRALFVERGFSGVGTLKDPAGHDRVTEGRWPRGELRTSSPVP